MKCEKCGYMYDDAIAACPLCGHPKDKDAAPAAANGAGEPPQAAPDYRRTQQPQQEPWQYRQQNQQAYRPSQQAPPPQYGVYGRQAQMGAEQPVNLSQARGHAAGALTCGILGLFFAVFPFAGIVLSIIALALGGGAKKKLPEAERGIAAAGQVLGIVGLVINAIILVIFIFTIAMAVTMAFDSFGSYYGSDLFDFDAWGSIMDSF